MKSVVILQSNYIPWRGYFDLIREADVFIYYDEVQYTKNDWRNRNIIVTKAGESWLTIPVKKTGRLERSILETEIVNNRWSAKHWNSLYLTYRRSPGFARWSEPVEELYQSLREERLLTNINRRFIEGLSKLLGISTTFQCSSDISSQSGKTERLVGLCKAVGATRYISGPAAKGYLNADLFKDAGIELTWKNYPVYEPYQQLDCAYRPGVSILDTLFQAPDIDVFAPQVEAA